METIIGNLTLELEKVANEICTNYCKYQEKVKTEADFEKMLETHCSDCPLKRID